MPVGLNAVVGLVGGPDVVAARVGEYLDAGADDIVIVPAATADDPAGERSLRMAAEVAQGLDLVPAPDRREAS